MDILPRPFFGNSDIEPSRYDVDMYDGTDGVTVYDVRMIMNCGERDVRDEYGHRRHCRLNRRC